MKEHRFGGNGYVHGAQLVVAAQHKHLVGKHDLLRKQVGQHLDRVLAAIDVVAQEEEASRSQMHSQRPQDLREGDQIRHVAVEVAKHVDGRLEFQKSGLRLEDAL